jgi:hypothetical protein
METKIEEVNKECILIEGLREADAEFYGKWLLAAAEANKLLERAYSQDPLFRERVGALEPLFKPDFGIIAIILFEKLAQGEHFYVSTIDLDSDEAQMFCVMAEMEFFKLNDVRYQMALPEGLDIVTVRNALLKLADTEDDEFHIHPEALVSCLSRAEARSLPRRIAN